MRFLLTSRSTSFDTPPRVIPIRSARTLGEVSSSSNISRITTHSATVTPLASSLTRKGLRDVTGDEAEPESYVLFKIADDRIGCFGVFP